MQLQITVFPHLSPDVGHYVMRSMEHWLDRLWSYFCHNFIRRIRNNQQKTLRSPMAGLFFAAHAISHLLGVFMYGLLKSLLFLFIY